MRRSSYIRIYLDVATLLATLYLVLPSNVSAFFCQENEANTTTSTGAAEKSVDATAENNLVVTNNTAVVRFSPSVWDRLPLIGDYTVNETVFQIRTTTKDVSNVVITSSGLGNAVFVKDGSPGTNAPVSQFARSCPEPSWAGTPSLVLPELNVGQEVKIRMRFPCDLINDPGDSLEGKILVIAPQQKLLEVPLKVQSSSVSTAYTALLAFVGIMVPALVAYSFYKMQNRWSEHRAQWAAHEKFILDNSGVLHNFFSAYYKEVVEHEDHEFARKLHGEIVSKGWVATIPPREWRRLEKAFSNCSRKTIRRRLAKLFPGYRQHI